METVFRYFAALYASRAASTFIKEGRHIVTMLTGNPYVTNPTPPLADVTVHLDTLEALELAAHHGPKGSVSKRNAALLVVRSDLRQLKACVQAAADADITHAQAIIESAGMYVTTLAHKAKAELAFRYGSGVGELELLTRALQGQGCYQWQMSADQKTWTDLPQTVTASTTVTGLTPATVYYFRCRTFTAAGYSTWSPTVSAIAH